MKKRVTGMTFVTLTLSLMLIFPLANTAGGSQNIWLSGWEHRKSHVIERTPGAGEDYQIEITVVNGSGIDLGDTVYINNKMRSDFGDIRFTRSDGVTPISYWMETKNDLENATFWLKIPEDLSTSEATFYVYYGNDTALTTSDGSNTFLLYDDFSGGSLNTTTWTSVGNGGTVAESGGMLQLTGIAGGDQARAWVRSASQQPYNVGVIARARQFTVESGIEIAIDWDGTHWLGIGGDEAVNGYFFDNVIHSGPSPVFLVKNVNYGETASTGTHTWGPSEIVNMTAGAWNIYEVDNYNKSLVESVNGTLVQTVLDNDSTTFSTFYVGLASREYPYETDFDWVAVRNYVNPEPQQGLWGTEETTSPLAPLWTQWYLWTNIALAITTVVFAFTTLYYRKRTLTMMEKKSVTPRTLPRQGKTCPKCGANMPEDARFCGKCGTSLE